MDNFVSPTENDGSVKNEINEEASGTHMRVPIILQ